MRISDLVRGQVLYEVKRERMGNTTMRTTAVRRVIICDIGDHWFEASWNSNPPKRFYSIPPSWRKGKPYLVRNGLSARPATRAERAVGEIVERSDWFIVRRRGES